MVGTYESLLWLCEWRLGGALYFQVVGHISTICDHRSIFLPQVVGTLKPSIEMLSLPLLCVCSFLLPLFPVHSPSLPFPPLCSLNSLDPSLTLPHRWWGPFHLVYKYPYWLPLTKMLGPWWGTYEALLWAMWMKIGWALYFQVVGHISTICDHQSFFCHRWWVP